MVSSNTREILMVWIKTINNNLSLVMSIIIMITITILMDYKITKMVRWITICNNSNNIAIIILLII